jgi:hypothetical protein
LYPLFPNPFNAAAELRFDLPRAGPVEITLYNLSGQEVRRLAAATYPAGSHTLSLNLPHAPSGVYYVRMTAGTFSAVQKAVLLK